jgi:hypothetical protein
MVSIERIPYEELPLPPERIRRHTQREHFFSPAIRDTFVANFQELAKRQQKDLFLATQEDGSSTFGLTDPHRVTKRQDGRVQLSGSHARYKLGQDVPELATGQTYDFFIDRSSNVILRADWTHKPPRIIGSPIAEDPIDIHSAVMPVSLEEAERFFSIVKRQPHIPFQYPSDGCWARAHEICRLIERHLDQNRRDVVVKVWHYGDLAVKTENSPECEVEWGFHVAPAVNVDNTLMVIDPSLFDHLVVFDQWRSAQVQSPSQSKSWALTSKMVYNRTLQGALYEETLRETERNLEEFRAFLFQQIYESGPIPYSCTQE